MKPIAVVVVASVLVLATTSYFSARIGYKAGLADAPGLIKSPDAAYMVAVLDRIEAGDTALAEKMLETQLDTSLIDRWAYDRRGQRFSSILRPAEITAIPELIGIGAQHRALKPSASTSDKTKSAIAEVVAKYAVLAPRQRVPN
jgi:hypothetical protein